MTAAAKISNYLVHQETGQRYAVGEEVVIGRAHGDIIFADDPKVSSQHCRIVRTPQGLGVHDLGSSNGTYLDGKRLDPEKVYVFKNGSTLTTGAQAFKLTEAKISAKPARRRRKKRKPKSSFDAFTVFGLIGFVIAIYFFAQLWQARHKAEAPIAKLESPFTMVEKEMKEAFSEYSDMGAQHAAGRITDKVLSASIRKDLMPRMNAAYERLGVLKPAGEYEKRKVELDRKLCLALLDQLNAMAYFAETKSPKYSAELDKYTGVAAALSEEARKLDSSRKPTNYDY